MNWKFSLTSYHCAWYIKFCIWTHVQACALPAPLNSSGRQNWISATTKRKYDKLTQLATVVRCV